MIKKLKSAEDQQTLPMACGGKNDHCREAWPKHTSKVIKEDVSKGPEFWLQFSEVTCELILQHTQFGSKFSEAKANIALV